MSLLSVVATPIGNLGDLSPRAAETLKNADLIVAEDTRVTMKLLSHLGVKKPMVSSHRHNEQDRCEALADRIVSEDLRAALVTDAGTPCISDPGTYLVDAAIRRHIPVEAVAGPSAMAAAVSVSGFDLTEFTFFGFLPREKNDLDRKLLKIASAHQGAVIHESPYRIKNLAESCLRVIPECRMSVSCDLTKLHEKTIRGTPAEILEALRANEKSEKGEYCVVLDLRSVPREAPQPAAEASFSLEAQLVQLLTEGMDMRTARDTLVARGEKKNAVYAASLHLKELI